jgi:hypothetical protein
MADPQALPVAVVLLVGLNLAYMGWAVSLPPDEGWMYYLDMEVPPEVGAGAQPDVMAARLVEAGYTVNAEFAEGAFFVTFTATRADDPAFRTTFRGAPGHGWTSISTEVFCRVGYLSSDCPADLEGTMRGQMQAAVAASGSVLDVGPAHLGDNDFAMWGSFVMMLGQMGLRALSVVALLVVALTNGAFTRPQRAVFVGPTGWPGAGAADLPLRMDVDGGSQSR